MCARACLRVSEWERKWEYVSVSKLERHHKCVRDKLVTVISLIVRFYMISLFLDVAVCKLVDRYQCFRRICAWMWRHQILPEFWYFCTKLHSATYKTIVTFIVPAGLNLNKTNSLCSFEIFIKLSFAIRINCYILILQIQAGLVLCDSFLHDFVLMWLESLHHYSNLLGNFGLMRFGTDDPWLPLPSVGG
jgi:hypothetical protein